ncbi:MAG: chromosomal replication initiator DnaA [Rhizobiales bacterium]|nr:chromosomal replication initiator DnaA [Hyphomicrobiales bacterium]
MTRQLVFELSHRPALGREDFLVAPSNEDAVALIDAWPNWPGQAAALSGPAGSGKSHLAEVWCERSRAVPVKAQALEAADVPALVARGATVVEDLEALNEAGERQLFHLINLMREEKGHLLLTAREAPAHLPLTLPDLVSRLKAMPHAALGAPDDRLLGGILVKLFADRQLHPAEPVISYLVSHMERSVAVARDLVLRLDRTALAGKRPITVPLAAEILQELGNT